VTAGADEVEIRWTQRADEIESALAVRERVFCEEQGVSREEERDGLDEGGLHLLAVCREGHVVGTLRLLLGGDLARVGRVAVDRDWRRGGIASRMLEAALAEARARGCREARLAAQLVATGLYERAGFTIESQPFEEAGITHVWMRRALP
jgi:predicted GNAT family N-acyltransferase